MAQRKKTRSWDEQGLRSLLADVAAGRTSSDAALTSLRSLPFEEMGFATLDHHRTIRKGFPEVIYCAGKTAAQVAAIAERLAKRGPRLLGTRATPEQFRAARRRVRGLVYDATARAIYLDREKTRGLAGVTVVAAGTSDLAVAEEAVLTLRLMGHAAERIYDVGVAGLHRLMSHAPALQAANVVIAVAGMEGALPSVVAGLVAAPVIAVPTSVGYGASFSGLAALLAMLNSCAPGLSVVNIDNGFGAGYLAAVVNRRIQEAHEAG
jgi:hypothetical protein